MGFPEELTIKCFNDEYWKELSAKILGDAESLTKKEFDDTERFIDLLTLTEHKEANDNAYNVLEKLHKYSINEKEFLIFKLNVQANLTRYENFNFEFTDEELKLISLDRRN